MGTLDMGVPTMSDAAMRCPDCGAKAQHDPVDAVGWFNHKPPCPQHMKNLITPQVSDAAVEAARTVAEDVLERWPRLLEKRCDEGEWVKLRDLFTEAIAAHTEGAVKVAVESAIQPWKEVDAAHRRDIADLTARLASAEGEIQKAVDSAVQPWKEVDAAHRRDIDALKAAVEQAHEKFTWSCAHFDDWYANGKSSDAAMIAYDLVNAIRQALSVLTSAAGGAK